MTTYLNPDDHEAFTKAAQRENRSVAAQLRHLAQVYLQQQQAAA